MNINTRRGAPADFESAGVDRLLQTGVYQPTQEKISRVVAELVSASGQVFLAVHCRRPIGLLGAVEIAAGSFVVRLIVVDSDYRMKEVGRQLMDMLVNLPDCETVEAETDDDAVGFYRALAFRVSSLGEKYPGVVRYRCLHDRTERN